MRTFSLDMDHFVVRQAEDTDQERMTIYSTFMGMLHINYV